MEMKDNNPQGPGRDTVPVPPCKTKDFRTRMAISSLFLFFLIALAYTPLSDNLKLEFAKWGFYGSIGYVGVRTFQNLLKERKG